MLKSTVKLLIASASFLLLTACATIKPSAVDAKLLDWNGADFKTVVQTWGVPTKETRIDSVTIAEWNSREIKNNPSFNVGIGGFGRHLFGSIGTTLFGGAKELHCRVQVSYNQKGTVIETHWTGDAEACDAAIPERAKS